jgi:hypothetical protein
VAEKTKRNLAIHNANAIHLSSRPRGWRWIVEALLCAGMTDREIADEIGMGANRLDIEAFRRIYFDVDAYVKNGRLSKTAVEANILSTSRSRAGDLENHDYIWKRVATRFGPDGFLSFLHGDVRSDIEDYRALLASSRNLDTALLFSESPAQVSAALGSDLAGQLLKLPQDIKAAVAKEKSGGGALDIELEEYFKRMIPLVVRHQCVVTSPDLVSGITIDGGRGIQRITSGGARLAIPQSVEARPA